MRKHTPFCKVSNVLAVSVLSLTMVTSAAHAATQPVYYDEQTLNEHAKENEFIGVSTGLIAGAILAGPIGAVVASISGAAIADSVNESHKSEALIAELQSQRSAYASLQEQYNVMLASSWDSRHQNEQIELVAVSQEQWQPSNAVLPVESQIQFTSGSADLQRHYVSGLSSLAKNLASRPDLRVQLHGYADRRGESEANLDLSQKRVESVATFLLQHGVASSQILSRFHGEAQPVSMTQSVESDFFDRRVVLNVQSADGMMTAAK